MCAVTVSSTRLRDEVLTALREREHMLILGTGERGIRFRPPLTVADAELDSAVDALDRVLTSLE
jgi:L-lysine 6-transaminase